MASPEDMVKLQRNLRLNQAELSDYLSDLNSWEDDIKKKDEVIKGIDEPSSIPASVVPPPRSTVKKSKQNQPTKPAAKTSDKKEKIRSNDYQAWDKFDVEEACEQIDDSTSASKPIVEESDDEDDANIEAEKQRQRAVFYKEQGNKCFKSGKNKDALLYYTKGIEADPSNALLFANRAMANLKDENYGDVISDCSTSIKLDPAYPKSFQRRGVAYSKLGKLLEAELDFKQVLKLLPDNKEATVELKKLALIKENKSGIANTNNIVLPVKKPASKRSKAPLVRIAVEQVRNESPSIALSSEADFIKKKELAISENGSGEFSNQKLVSKPSSTLITECSSFEYPDVHVNGDVPSEKQRSPRPIESQTPVVTTIPEAATSSMQFMIDFRRVQAAPELFFQYLQKIQPGHLCKLIPASSLDAKLLRVFLEVLRDFYLPNKVPLFETLKSLTYIKRFSMMTMFLNETEKDLAKLLIEHVKSTEGATDSEISSLYKSFSL
jgi:tetratricopeptide (TPR) repeat protein